MYGSEKMYLSPQKNKRIVWSKAQLDARKRRLGLDEKYKLIDWDVIHINRNEKIFTIQFKVEGNVDEARYAINEKIKELKDDQVGSKNEVINK